MNEALPFLILGLIMVPVFGLLAARDNGKFSWPRWPARYPAAPRRKPSGEGEVGT